MFQSAFQTFVATYFIQTFVAGVDPFQGEKLSFSYLNTYNEKSATVTFNCLIDFFQNFIFFYVKDS